MSPRSTVFPRPNAVCLLPRQDRVDLGSRLGLPRRPARRLLLRRLVAEPLQHLPRQGPLRVVRQLLDPRREFVHLVHVVPPYTSRRENPTTPTAAASAL